MSIYYILSLAAIHCRIYHSLLVNVYILYRRGIMNLPVWADLCMQKAGASYGQWNCEETNHDNDIYRWVYIAPKPSKTVSSSSPPWKRQISHSDIFFPMKYLNIQVELYLQNRLLVCVLLFYSYFLNQVRCLHCSIIQWCQDRAKVQNSDRSATSYATRMINVNNNLHTLMN